MNIIWDLEAAKLCGVTPEVLRRAVKRNIKRFPRGFLVKRKDRLAFTAEGFVMLSAVLRSKRAAEMNILVIRQLAQMKGLLDDNEYGIIR